MGNGQYAQKKTCGIKQHVKIDNIFEEPNLICGKPAVGEKINSTRYNQKLYIVDTLTRKFEEAK